MAQLRETLKTTRIRDVKGALAVLVLEARARKAGKLEVVVELPYVSEETYSAAKDFMGRVAPDVAFRLEGKDGTRAGTKKAALRLRQRGPRGLNPTAVSGSVELFTDLHQWLLKYLLLYANKERPGSLRALAREANVSLPTAQRFVEAFTQIGHLTTTDLGYRVVRRRELMRRWLGRWDGQHDLWTPVQSIFGRDRLLNSLGEHAANGVISAAIGGFAACASRKVLHVTARGAPELHLDERGVEQLWKQARPCGAHEADVVIACSEAYATSIFRPIDRRLERVGRGPLPTVDLIQIALDVSTSPLAGEEQAQYIIGDVLGWDDGDET